MYKGDIRNYSPRQPQTKEVLFELAQTKLWETTIARLICDLINCQAGPLGRNHEINLPVIQQRSLRTFRRRREEMARMYDEHPYQLLFERLTRLAWQPIHRRSIITDRPGVEKFLGDVYFDTKSLLAFDRRFLSVLKQIAESGFPERVQTNFLTLVALSTLAMDRGEHQWSSLEGVVVLCLDQIVIFHNAWLVVGQMP